MKGKGTGSNKRVLAFEKTGTCQVLLRVLTCGQNKTDVSVVKKSIDIFLRNKKTEGKRFRLGKPENRPPEEQEHEKDDAQAQLVERMED